MQPLSQILGTGTANPVNTAQPISGKPPLSSIFNTQDTSKPSLDSIFTGTQPTTEPTIPEEKPSVGGFINNIGSSAWNFGSGIVQTVLHPLKTVEGIEKVGAGAVLKGVGALTGKDFSNDQAVQAFDKVVNFYGQRYGGKDIGEVAKHVANTAYTDPIGFLMDASVLTGGIEGGANAMRVAGQASDIAELTAGMSAIDKAAFLEETSRAGVLGKGAQVAQGVSDVAKTLNPAVQAGKIIGKATEGVKAALPEKLATAGENAKQGLSNWWDETLNATKSGFKGLAKSEAAGKDTTDFLANKQVAWRNLGLNVKPEIVGTKLDLTKMIEQLNKDSEPMNTTLRKYLENKPEMVQVDDLRNQVLKAVDTPDNKAANLTETLQKEINNEFDNYKKAYGDWFKQVDLQDIKVNKIKQSGIFDQTKPKWRSDVDYQIGKAARQAIEGSAGKDSMEAQLNKYIGDHMDAVKQLNKINGQTIKGGRLGKYVGMVAGSSIGKSPLGKVAGLIGGNWVADVLINMDVNNPIRNILLKYAKDNEPRIYQEALDAIKESEAQRATRLALPGAGETSQGPIELPEAGVLKGQQTLKEPIGVNPETKPTPTIPLEESKIIEENKKLPPLNMLNNPEANPFFKSFNKKIDEPTGKGFKEPVKTVALDASTKLPKDYDGMLKEVQLRSGKKGMNEEEIAHGATVQKENGISDKKISIWIDKQLKKYPTK